MTTGKSLDRRLELRVLIPLMLAMALMQIVVPLARIATSYKAIELELSFVQVGSLSSAFALLPILLAVSIGRHNDRHGEGGLAMWGAVLVAMSVLGLWLLPSAFFVMFACTCVLGVGQVTLLSALQTLTTKCSGPEQHDRVLGYFLVSAAAGQVIGPLAIGFTTPVGAIYPDERLQLIIGAAAVALISCTLLLKTGLSSHVGDREESPASVGEILRLPGLWIILLSSGVCTAANDLLLVFFPVLGASRDIDAATIGYLLSLRALATVGSRLFFSRLVARVGRPTLMVAALLTTAVATGSLALDLPTWGMSLVMVASGLTMALTIACTISLTLSMAPPSRKATAMSLRLTFSRLVQFLLPLGAGALASMLGPGSIFAVSGAGLLMCCALLRLFRNKVNPTPAGVGPSEVP